MTIPPLSQLVTRPLFGGAIHFDLPSDYLDASDLRQIPDDQEVFLSSSSETSIVIEILSMVEEGPAVEDLWEAAKYHFSSIAHDNSSLRTFILTPPPPAPVPSRPQSSVPPRTPQPTILEGTQEIHKFSHDTSGAPRRGHEEDVPDTVWIGLALWRVWIEPPAGGAVVGGMQGGQRGQGVGQAGQGGQGDMGAGRKKADLVVSVNINLSAEGGRGEEERRSVGEWWGRSVRGLRILDFGLFGDVE